MMVDTSAIVAILRNEPEARAISDALEKAKRAYIVSPILLELCMVMLNKKSPDGLAKIRQTLREVGISVVPFTPDMSEYAVQAFFRYGKGRSNKAQLNFGDCMSYAAAKVEAMPLLFKGDDFRHTDVECAI